MSVTNGGTALKPCSRGGRFPGSAGSAGISITLRTAHLLFLPPSSRYHIQMEDERSIFSFCKSDGDGFSPDQCFAQRNQISPYLIGKTPGYWEPCFPFLGRNSAHFE